ncbi:hypothetical protein BV898_19753, partial [Hypsibius exemplaris]
MRDSIAVRALKAGGSSPDSPSSIRLACRQLPRPASLGLLLSDSRAAYPASLSTYWPWRLSAHISIQHRVRSFLLGLNLFGARRLDVGGFGAGMAAYVPLRLWLRGPGCGHLVATCLFASGQPAGGLGLRPSVDPLEMGATQRFRRSLGLIRRHLGVGPRASMLPFLIRGDGLVTLVGTIREKLVPYVAGNERSWTKRWASRSGGLGNDATSSSAEDIVLIRRSDCSRVLGNRPGTRTGTFFGPLVAVRS